MYQICLWGSHPDEGNDDCFTGRDYAEHDAAEAAFELFKAGKTPAEFDNATGSLLCTTHVELCKVTRVNAKVVNLDAVLAVARLPGADKVIKRRQVEDDMERRERAMQAGMMGGCAAYNDAIGSG